MDWKSIGISSIPFAIFVLGFIIWLFVRRSIRTRLQIAKALKNDPQINDWLVIFNWSRKVLYIPTILASLIAAGLTALDDAKLPWLQFPEWFPLLLGGIWMGIFFINFLIDEFEINLKVLGLIVLTLAVLGLWLTLMNWLTDFLHFFRHLGLRMNVTGYLMFAGVFMLAIVISWIRGLFYFVAMTPNYINIQNGPNETSEQISREAYSTRIDTGDFMERMLGFGQIIITFADTRRQPLTLLLGRIGVKAKTLESIRGHLQVESITSHGEPGQAQ